ncbi:MAG TPA: hypothetical protein PKJ14_01745 [Candidatus Cloacimonadota bacterium]|nr:hypothetical protein [Candidatus Cloacimonadota bacterium]HQL14418.1 hypothetical protein [Candidatus Cloacimonadota bacterium]
MSNIIRYYIFGKYDYVIESQVMNWVKVIPNENIITIYVSIISNPQNRLSATEIAKIQESINSPYIEYMQYRYPIIREIGSALLILKLYLRNFTKYDKMIFQSRSCILGFTAILLRFLPKVTFIFEARASGVIEFKDYNKSQSIKMKWQLRKLQLLENLYLRNADRIICVSNKLKEYFLYSYNLKQEQKFVVIPGVADANMFYFDSNLRCKMREEYKVEQNIIFLYSGGLYLPWQMPDRIFNFFERLYNLNSKSFFVVLTKQTDMAISFFKRHNIPDNAYITMFVSQEELNQYYNMADYGLLFRENKPTNNTASPTKFSEYILSGLPTLITEGIGDFSEFVVQNNCGYLLALSQTETDNIGFLFDNKFSNHQREQIAEIGYKALSKQSYSSVLMEVLGVI